MVSHIIYWLSEIDILSLLKHSTYICICKKNHIFTIYSIIWENRTASGPSLKFGFHSSSVFRKPRFLGTRKRSDSVIHNAQHSQCILTSRNVCTYVHVAILKEVTKYNILLFIQDISLKSIKSKLNKTFSTRLFVSEYRTPYFFLFRIYLLTPSV